MKVRSSVAAVLVLSLFAQPARAQESAAPVQLVVHAPTPIDLRIDDGWRAPSIPSAPMGSWFAAKPAPIKLSQAAITAIIIGGVVLVVLVVAGVAVLGKPGKVR